MSKDKKIRAGRLQMVENKDRKFGSALEYFALWVEDSNGKNERCLLFTEKEIKAAEKRAAKNPEDLTKKGWLTDLLD